MPDIPARTEAPKLKLTDWVVRAAVAFVFVSSGLEKFSIGPGAEWIKMFARIGWGDWFRYLTGGLEIAGGILLMLPSFSTAGAALLAACMVGAVFFHIFVLGDPFSSIINILLIVAIVFAARIPKTDADEINSLRLD
jgi:putative oxidoreductase